VGQNKPPKWAKPSCQTQGGSKVSLLGFRTFPNVTSVLEFTDYWKVDPKFLGEQMTLEGVECPALYVPVEKR
jgi:hypothetical protein